jgi:MraZ protein
VLGNAQEQIERKLMSLPSLNERARRLQRLMVGHADDLELDGHGRLLLPPQLREFAGLDRRAMLVGQGGRFELWDEARWVERRDFWLKSEESATDLSAELDSLSL